MPRIVIRNVSDIRKLQQKFRGLSTTLPTLQKTALEKSADETILNDIHTDMESSNFSKKIIEHTNVGDIIIRDKSAKVHFISDFVSDNSFDVSKAREEGTADHDVFPKDPNGSLSYIDKSIGKRVFRKHTRPSGMARLLIIKTNVLKGKQKFLDAYKNNISSSLNQVLS